MPRTAAHAFTASGAAPLVHLQALPCSLCCHCGGLHRSSPVFDAIAPAYTRKNLAWTAFTAHSEARAEAIGGRLQAIVRPDLARGCISLGCSLLLLAGLRTQSLEGLQFGKEPEIFRTPRGLLGDDEPAKS